MIKFTNKSSEPTHKIEIFGEIGESFWGDGITLQSFANDLKNAESKPLNILINSLGGDVNTAFAIHDIIKAYQNKKTAQIIGFAASSAINIAVACDTVEMSKNAMALIHNCSTMVSGNSEDIEKALLMCNKTDDVIVNLYKNKSGKPKSIFYAAMEKAQWLTADEMKDLGLVDKIIEPEKINNSIYEKINNSTLPKIKIENNMEKTILEQLTEKVTEVWNHIKGEKTESKLDFTAIENKIAEIQNEVIVVKTENETLKAEISNHATKITDFESQVTAKNAEIERIKNEFAEYAKNQGKEITFDDENKVIKNGIDPVKPKVLSEVAQNYIAEANAKKRKN